MEKLTYSQERRILEAILNDSLADHDNGSSRVVFLELGENTNKVLRELNIPTNCVIKVNIGSAGCEQSYQEREIFSEAYDNYDDNILATIYAYGDVVQIMEKLQPCNFLESVFDECYGSDESGYFKRIAFYEQLHRCMKYSSFLKELEPFEREDRLTVLAEKMFDYLQAICQYTGPCGDNYQVGLDAEGNIKSYDYGFIKADSEEYHDSHCFAGDYDGIAWRVDDYIRQILQLPCFSPAGLQDVALEF